MKVWLALVVACAPLAAQVNLVPNGGFEDDRNADGMPDVWDQQRQQNNQGVFAADRQVFSEGAASLRIEHPDDNAVWVRSSVQDLPASPRTLYRIDAVVRATGPYTLVLYEFQPDNQKQPYLTHNVAAGKSTDGQWRAHGLAVMTGEQARTFKISCITNGRGMAWFDDLRLVKVGAIPDADAVMVAQPPRLDGRLDDPAWRAAPRIGPCYRLGGAGERPRAATWFRVVWTPTHLYVAFVAEEPKVAAMKAAIREYDLLVYQDDCVEAFLDPEHEGTGFCQLVVNSLGTRFDRRALPTRLNTTWFGSAEAANVDWDPAWEAAATVGPAEWSAELALPFAAVGEAPRPGDVWGANFCRERYAVEELSTWAPLPGDTFHQPAHFGRLTFRGPAPQPPEVLTRTAAQAAAPLPLIPRPKEVRPGDGQCLLPARLRLRAGSPGAATYAAACAPLLGPAALATGPAAPGDVVLAIDDGSLKLPAEGYRLQVAPAGVTVTGADPSGVRNGLMTLSQLLDRAPDRRLGVTDIRDWPDLAVRGWHVGSPAATEGQVFRNWVETLARLKFNTLMLEVNDQLRYQSHPEIGRPDAPTKEQLAEWVAYARSLGFEVIPQVQVYGHFNWVLNKPGWADLAENPEATGRWGAWNANIRDPRYYPLVFDLYQEALDVFKPSIFHIGHDEITFQPIGVHPATRGSKPHELFAEEVTKLHAWLTGKGVKVMMWGDQLLEKHHGGPPHNTWLATDLVPKDILIADWHYGPDADYPSVAYFREHGFPVVACGWWNPLNMVNFSNAAVDQKILGFSGTSWWGLSNFGHSAEHQTAFVLAAENSWSNRNPAIDQFDYQPLDAWRRLSGWGRPPAETSFAPIDLSRYANQTLSDTRRRTGWFGLGPANDFALLPRGVQWWRGVPYRVLDGPAEAVMLAAEGDPARSWPTAVNAIAVGVKASALYLAATCSAPVRRYPNIYDREKSLPSLLGKLVVRYADGTREELPLRYRRNLTDWNGDLPPAWAPTIWSGHTTGGAWAQLAGWRWDNPWPDKVIDSLDIVSAESPLRVAVIALTAALP